MQKNGSNTTQYPAQSGPYKVFVKDKGTWQHHSVARLQISVGNPKHQGAKMFALAEWAAGRFEKVIFIVSDTLQRHNLAYEQGLPADQAYRLSSMMGKHWLQQNRAAIQAVPTASRQITLWDDWLHHEDFFNTHQALTALYESDAGFKSATQAKAAAFCKRGHWQGEQALAVSVRYILEEIAAFAIMFRETKAIDIYPGEWFKDIFEVLANRNTGPLPLISGFREAECMRVDFTRNKGFMPMQDPHGLASGIEVQATG